MIVENAGIDSGWVIREIESQGGNHGYNVMTMKFEDMIKSGIVDPAKLPVPPYKTRFPSPR